MEKMKFDSKNPPDELHIKDVGAFFLVNKKAYYKDGRPVEPNKLRVCQHCQSSPPFVATKEIDFAKHMVDKHPEYANGKTPPEASGPLHHAEVMFPPRPTPAPTPTPKKKTKKAVKKTTKKK